MPRKSVFYEYTPSAHLLVTDEDAADFLQSQFSNDLRPFTKGQCRYGLWLNVKGRVIGDSVLLCEGRERFRLLSEGSRGDVIKAHLEKHIIADDVEIESLDPVRVFEFQAEAVSVADLSIPDPGTWQACEGGRFFAYREGIVQFVADSPESGDAFRRRLLSAGLQAQDGIGRALSRIQAGIPSIPEEIGAEDLPGEGELLEAISFTKGCYLGQEVVARMHNIGQAQRRLFVVGGPGKFPGEVPCPLSNADGKKVGELRSAFPEGDSWAGVALLKTRFIEPGQSLLAGELSVTVSKPLRERPHND